MSRVSYPPSLDASDGPAYDPTDRPFVPAAGGSVISCAYALDDDGTLAGAFGFGHAGPAVGDGQRMDYDLTGSATGGTALLMPAGALGAASFDLPSSGSMVVEAQVVTGNADGCGVAVLWHNGGTLTDFMGNAGIISGTGVLGIRVTSAGVVRWFLDGVIQADPGKTVPSGQKVAFYLFANDAGLSTLPANATVQLRTQAADYSYGASEYGAGAADPCGNEL